jgi:hypothetical protein
MKVFLSGVGCFEIQSWYNYLYKFIFCLSFMKKGEIISIKFLLKEDVLLGLKDYDLEFLDTFFFGFFENYSSLSKNYRIIGYNEKNGWELMDLKKFESTPNLEGKLIFPEQENIPKKSFSSIIEINDCEKILRGLLFPSSWNSNIFYFKED